jgi:hypothetical protein
VPQNAGQRSSVSKRTIFISCGQFTQAEKLLGKQIAEIVRKDVGLEPFFAEEVQDLSGLDSNILNALHDCVAFITVLHPRGRITRPDNSALTRASVWIEQEIAIVTYIQRVEKRSLPIIAFKHKSVGREGLRDLLHLNPIEFTDEAEVLAALPDLLKPWRSLRTSGIELELVSKANRKQDGHVIRILEVTLVNDTDQRITEYDGEIFIPSGILKHFHANYPGEHPSSDPHLRRFRFDQSNAGGLRPRDRLRLTFFEYCTQCAYDAGDLSVGSLNVIARVWINGSSYSVEKSLQELAMEAERKGEY